MKRATTSKSIGLPQTDDLKLINGIGPAVERRLHGVGVYTFAQLAVLSPADIAASVVGLSGLTAERINKQGWIGQARKLAIETKLTEPEGDVVITTELRRSATFTLELLLDEDNTVRSSHIGHIQSGYEDSWDGWQNEKLVGFLVERAELSLPLGEQAGSTSAEREAAPPVLPEIEPAAPAVEEAEVAASLLSEPETAAPVEAPPIAEQAEISSPVAAAPISIGVLSLRELEVIATDSQDPQNFLSQGQPFSVRLTLDLADVTVHNDIPLNLKASIYSKSLDGRPRQTVGEASSIITSTDKVTVNVKGRTLARGIHRLQAVATLQPANIVSIESPGSTAAIDGGLLVIF